MRPERTFLMWLNFSCQNDGVYLIVYFQQKLTFMISKGQTFIMFDGSFQFIDDDLHRFLNTILIKRAYKT